MLGLKATTNASTLIRGRRDDVMERKFGIDQFSSPNTFNRVSYYENIVCYLFI